MAVNTILNNCDLGDDDNETQASRKFVVPDIIDKNDKKFYTMVLLCRYYKYKLHSTTF